MNKLSDLLMQDCIKEMHMGILESLEYIATGSIIANCNVKERKEFYELHGSLPAKLYILIGCVETLAKEIDVPISEILDYINNMSPILNDPDKDSL